ncbi:cookie monster [Musca autumnalis]|uniref:cookie monster n=1 Tax=Musca autumnalis TaxID=221902 RepID=UPI003CF0230E
METPGNTLNISCANITRPDILNFPFPYKLWLVINLEYCEFLRWNRDGTIILLDLSGLESYLNSMRSVFKIKNCSVFLQHLKEFNFERLNVQLEDEEDLLLQYKHANFQRYRLDLLANVRRVTTTNNQENQCPNSNYDKAENYPGDTKKCSVSTNNSRKFANRMMGDLCFMSHGSLSKIQKSRLRFQTVFNFESESRILREKLRISDEIAERNKNSRLAKTPLRGNKAGLTNDDQDQVIEVSADLYENPHDSVLTFADDFRPEYAGYYGSVSKEMLVNFFGEYLPTYAEGTMEVQKVIAESSAANKTPMTTDVHSDATISTDMPFPPNTINENFQTTNDMQHFSSKLQPIYKKENEPRNTFDDQSEFHIFSENLSTDQDTEISMDEFLKFKDPLALHCNDNDLEENKENRNNPKSEKVLGEFSKLKDPLAMDNNNKPRNIEMPHCSKNKRSFCQKAGYPQMPADVKLELEEDKTKKDEANFRSFFRQYKASLNLLYEDN